MSVTASDCTSAVVWQNRFVFTLLITGLLVTGSVLWSQSIRRHDGPAAGSRQLKAAEDTALHPSPASAFDETTHTSWTRRDGAPGSISALAQTKDGFLWIGSSLGLYRFDGIRFSSYPFHSVAAPLPPLDISSLAADPNGGLWIGTRTSGVIHLLVNGATVTYGRSNGLTSDTLDKVVVRSDGTVWAIGGSRLLTLQRERWIDFGQSHALPKGGAFSVFFDREGNIWVGQAEKLSVLRKGSTRFAEVPISVLQVGAMVESRSGELWISDGWRSVRPVSDASATGVLPIHGKAQLLADSEDNLWVAQDYFGLARIRHMGQSNQRVEAGSSVQDLTSSQTRAILQDREGNVWVGTELGLDRFQKTSFVHFRATKLNHYPALVAGEGGSVWINSPGSPLLRFADGETTAMGHRTNSGPLARRRNGDVCFVDATKYELQCYGGRGALRVPVSAELNRAPAQSMIEDVDGSLLISFQGKGLWRYDERWERVSAPGLPSKATWAMLLDSHERLWLGYPNDQVVVRRKSRYETLRVGGGYWGNTLTFYEAAGTLWVAGSNGLCFFDGQQFRRVRARDADLLRGISGVVLDRFGDLWLNAWVGAIRISADEVGRVLKNPQRPVKAEVFDENDGVRGEPTQFKPTPSAVADAHGTLWFATGGDVVSLDPAKLRRPKPSPNVLVESVLFDGKPAFNTLSWQGAVLHADAGRLHNLEIDYVGINLSAPERISYRYRLVGEDDDWQEVEGRRQAFYTRLSPGSYQFLVSASNGDGQWSDLAAPLRVDISPALYQTWWFRSTAAVLLVVLLWLAYLLRMRQVTSHMRMRIEERANERMRIARELHDTLLQSIHGLMLRFHYATETIPAGAPARDHLELALARADEVILEGRQRVQDLRSEAPVANDLAAELARAGRDLCPNDEIFFNVTEQGTKRAIQPLIQQELFIILREALANAFRHSQAKRVDLELFYGNLDLKIHCSDNGIGMDPSLTTAGPKGHFGLVGMQERARSIGAKFALWSAPGKGTELDVRIAAFRCYRAQGPIQHLVGLLRAGSRYKASVI